MTPIRRHLASPAMIVACMSLVVALGGVSYAAGVIGSAQIKDNGVRSKDLRDNDVRGKDVRDDALTGADVLESSLGAVPSATSATSANHAGTADNATSATNASHASTAGKAASASDADHAANADKVGGVTVKGFAYKTLPGGELTTLFSLNGLTVTAHCNTSRVDARTSVDDAYISASYVRGANTPERTTNPDFDTAEVFPAITGATTETGSIEYVRPDGRRVSVTLQADMWTDCTVSGHALASG